ncbi:MAG: hypothetical protein K8J08_17130, partial [Thermoanaerobaculia bacterium]|nr:hypothetical protein [Thermoanaerobaculia bacterium]
LFVATSIGPRLLHPRSGKWSVNWDSGWTVVPGWVHLTGAEVQWAVRRSEGTVTIDKANVYLVLPSLVLRHLDFTTTRATGVEMHVKPVESAADKPRKKGEGWKFTLGGLDVQDLRELAFDTERWAGAGEVQGMISWQVRGPTRLALRRVSLGKTQLPSDASRYVEQLELEASDFEFGPFLVARDSMVDGLESVSGHLKLTSHSKSLGFLGYFLQKVPWLELSGVGELALEVELDHGELEPGSRLSFSGAEVGVHYFGFSIAGSGSVEGRVDDASNINLLAQLEKFDIGLEDQESVVQGEEVMVRLMSPSPVIYQPATALEVIVDLPSAVASNVAVFSRYTPPAAGLTLSGGEVEVQASITYDSGRQTGSGTVSMVGDGLRATLSDIGLQFDVDLGIVLSEAKFEDGQVQVSGTELKLHNLYEVSGGSVKRGSTAGGWWARVRVPSGEVHRTETADGQTRPGLTLDLEADLRDSALVLDFLTARLNKLYWFKNFLSVTDVRAGVGLEVEESTIALHDLSILGGEDIEVLAELKTDQGERTGVLFARYKKLSAALGLGLEGKKPKDWKLTNSRNWYQKEAVAFRGKG